LQLRHAEKENIMNASILARELNKEENIEAIVNGKVMGLSGVEHVLDILIRKPCNIAIILPERTKEIAAEVIKAVVMTIDTKIPIIFPVSKQRSENIVFDLIREYPIVVIPYERVDELIFKIKNTIFDICCK